MIRLAERTYPEAARLARDPRSVVILPLGAVEQHGPHLPLLVDWLGAEALAEAVAPHLERAGYRVILAPALPYGASPLAAAWAGTVSLSAATLRRAIVEIVGSLARPGFRRFVLSSYQADGAPGRAMGEAKRALLKKRAPGGGGRLRIQFAGFSPEASTRAAMLSPRVLRLSRSPRPAFEWHSGELETALVLARRPELARRGLIKRLPPVWVDWGAGRGPRGHRPADPPATGGADGSRDPARVRGGAGPPRDSDAPALGSASGSRKMSECKT